jgi:hypothetical protein
VRTNLARGKTVGCITEVRPALRLENSADQVNVVRLAHCPNNSAVRVNAAQLVPRPNNSAGVLSLVQRA